MREAQVGTCAIEKTLGLASHLELLSLANIICPRQKSKFWFLLLFGRVRSESLYNPCKNGGLCYDKQTNACTGSRVYLPTLDYGARW